MACWAISFGGVLLIGAIVNIALENNWVDTTVFAIAVGGATFLAGWAGFSPRRSIARPSLALLICIWFTMLIPLASLVAEWAELRPDEMGFAFSPSDNTFPLVSILPVYLAGYAIIRLLAYCLGRRFVRAGEEFDFPDWRARFAVRHLLITMALVAVTLACARIAIPVAIRSNFGFLWELLVTVSLSFSAASLLVTIPAWWLTAKSVQRPKRVFIFWLIYCFVLSVIAVVALTIVFNGPTSDPIVEPLLGVLSMFLVQSFVVWLSVKYFQRHGYGLIRLEKRNIVLPVSSSEALSLAPESERQPPSDPKDSPSDPDIFG